MALPDLGAHGYRLTAILGKNPEGGRVAYRGVRERDARDVVVKRFSFADKASTWESYQAHERELAILRGLSHPRIPAYLDHFQDEHGFSVVQAFCPAPAMSARRLWRPDEVRTVARSALELLVYLQSLSPPVVHRDLKPDNILVDDRHQAHFVDFGLARADTDRASTVAAGTPGFVPPEQLLGHALTTATDLYGLGASLVAALTGTPSNEIGALVDASFTFDLSRLPPAIDDEFKRWLERMLAPSLMHRFSSAKEALAALDQPTPAPRKKQPTSASTPAPPRPTVPARPHARASRQRPRAAPSHPRRVVVVASVVALGAAFGLFFQLGTPAAPSADPTAPRDIGLTCSAPMTIEHDIVMRQQHPAIVARDGCRLTMRDAAIRGHIGIVVEGGEVTLERVRFETRAPAVELRTERAVVTANAVRMSCGQRCVMQRGGRLTLDDAQLGAESIALDLQAGQAHVTRSTIRSGRTAVAVYQGSIALSQSTLTGSALALEARPGTHVAIDGGRFEGGLRLDPQATVEGLHGAEVALGSAAPETWAELTCAPLLACMAASERLGSYAIDLRVPIGADGVPARPETLQSDLAAEDLRCIESLIQQVELPGYDGQTHVVRCTLTGQRMAGGGAMQSRDYRLER